MELIPKSNFLYIFNSNDSDAASMFTDFKALCSKEDLDVIDCPDCVKGVCLEEDQAYNIIKRNKPSIILIQESLFTDNPVTDYKSEGYDPYVIILLEDGDLISSQDKILDYIKAGADEVIQKQTSAQEIFFKCFSYMRRKSTLELNQLTLLPSINKTYNIISHCRNNLSDWVLVHLDTINFKSYNLMYGTSKGDEAIKLIGESLSTSAKKDLQGQSFVGHLGRDKFVIICESNSLETILKNIQSDFTQILDRLYKPEDFQNQYIICAAPNKIRRRVGLLRLNIGYCTNIDRSYHSSTDIIEQAIQNKKSLASGNKKILVLEDDNDFANLLADTFNVEGFEARVSKGLDHIIQEVAEFEPRILILEAASIGKENFHSLCKDLLRFKSEIGLKILVATNVPGYQNFLAAGADVYLPKPYDLEVIFREVRRLRFSADTKETVVPQFL